jgi:tRNA pseudouridine55 synthase
LDGILNIDKPAGITSYGAVARIKRLTGEKRVGHAGTLDPDATGVLPVCLGKATRIVQYLSEFSKTYVTTIELGVSTDTYDASGQVTRRADASAIDRVQLESALQVFKGDIAQTPPMYSALKHQGQPLYKLARAGVTIERKSRTVTIQRLEIIEYHPPEVMLEIECSKGTYIRSLANDLGQALGCGAYMKALKRTAYGVFDLKDAVPLSQLEEGKIEQFLRPIDCVLQNYPGITVDDAGEKAMRQGKMLASDKVTRTEDSGAGIYRAYTTGGAFIGLASFVTESGMFHLDKLLI